MLLKLLRNTCYREVWPRLTPSEMPASATSMIDMRFCTPRHPEQSSAPKRTSVTARMYAGAPSVYLGAATYTCGSLSVRVGTQYQTGCPRVQKKTRRCTLRHLNCRWRPFRTNSRPTFSWQQKERAPVKTPALERFINTSPLRGRARGYLTSISSYLLVPRPIFSPCSIMERQLVSGCVMLK